LSFDESLGLDSPKAVKRQAVENLPSPIFKLQTKPLANLKFPKPVKKKRRRDITQTYWAAEQDELESKISRSARDELLRKFGDFSLAFSTAVQPRLEYFGDDQGFISYRRRWGVTFALGDVVAAPDRIPELVDGFVRQQKHVVFCQASRTLAAHLNDRGFFVNEMGVDTTIDLADYTFVGKQKEWLRYAANWCQRREFRIIEANFGQIHPDQVEEVSEAWRNTRTVKSKEVRFLNRPIVLEDEPDVRKFFFLSPQGKLLAFIFLDPLYRDGQLIGFVTAFKRRHPEAPMYSEQALMKRVIEVLKDEGHQVLRLGLSPLANIADDRFMFSSLTQRVFNGSYNAGWVNRYFYHLHGHADYKRRFRGNEEKVYFCSNRGFSLYRLFALIGLCGVA
jgi:phosphatidylglycerol lysyltransferase